MALITHTQALKIIQQMVRDRGSKVAVAKELDISPGYMADILSGRKAISDAVARKLGYRRVVMFTDNGE